MKNGFRVYDTDTHIDPGADVLERYVDPGFRARLDDLAPYRVAIKSRSTDGGTRNTYRFDQKLYERTLGEAEARPGTGDGRVWRGERRPGPGVVDDRSDNRVLDMDAEGYLLPKNLVESEIPGVFIAGDVADRVYKQAVTAAGMGCAAALQAEKYLSEVEGH